MKQYLTLDSVDVYKKVVGIRVDINSAIIHGEVQVSGRIKEACKSISELIKKKATVLIFAHQGRKGKNDFTSLELHKKKLEEILNTSIEFIPELSAQSVHKALSNKNSKIFLLENLRELDCEQKPTITSKGTVLSNPITQIIELCDYYIIDAFSIAHRAHSSIIGTKTTPCIAGRLLERELKPLSVLEKTPHPRIFIMGGVKPDDLVPLISKSLEQKNVDYILLGGVIGELALHIQGVDIGKKWNWIVENEYHLAQKELSRLLKKYPSHFILPKDVAYLDTTGKRVEVSVEVLKKNSKVSSSSKAIKECLIEDIGSQTLEEFSYYIKESKSCYVKGPVGNFEKKGLEVGTYSLFRTIVSSNTFSFMGGGHSVTAAEKSKTIQKFSYVSLAGGALVQFLEGKKLPGIQVLEDSYISYAKTISKTHEFDLVVVGSNVVDMFIHSPVDVSTNILGEKIKIEEDFEESVGGGGVNVSSIVSKLNAKVGLITRRSVQNKELLDMWSREKEFSILSSKIHEQSCAKSVILETPSNDRVIFTHRGQNQDFSTEDVPKHLPTSNYYFSGLTKKAFKTQIGLIKKIKKEQPFSMISYNPSSYTIKEHGEEITQMLKFIDVLIFNKEEAELLTHERGIEQNLHLLSTMGPKFIIITDGSKGSWGIEDGNSQIIYQHVPKQEIIADTTGAGDCFAGTCFYFLTKFYSLEQAMKLATLNASHLVRQKGSTNGSLTLHQLKRKQFNI